MTIKKEIHGNAITIALRISLFRLRLRNFFLFFSLIPLIFSYRKTDSSNHIELSVILIC